MNWYKTAQEKVKFNELAIGDTFYHTYYGTSTKTGPNTYDGDTKTNLTIRNEEDYVNRYPKEEQEEEQGDTMDIGSGAGYPAASLSNFSPHPFSIDGVQCASMEGFLQSLKYKGADMQREVCTLVGKAAKFKGKKKKWFRDQTLYWQGRSIPRKSGEYQELLDKAFNAMFEQSNSFKKALKASGKATLTHSMGKNDESRTVLTNREFIRRLTQLRAKL